MPQTDPVAALLDRSALPREIKAEVWDAYHEAGSTDELVTKLDALNVSRELKAELWDLKAGHVAPMNFATVNGQPQEVTPPGFLDTFLPRANPVNLVKGIGQQAQRVDEARRQHPVAAAALGPAFTAGVVAKDLATGLVAEGVEGGRYLREGNYPAAAGVVLGAPVATALTEGTIGLGARALRALPNRTPNLQTRNPTAQAAIDFADREGIPVSVAGRTDNRFAKSAEHLVDRTLGGSVIEQGAAREQVAAVEAQMRKQAGRANPQPVSPVAAGEEIESAFGQRLGTLDAMADQNYGLLRQIEKDPKNLDRVPMKITMTDSAGKTSTVTRIVEVPMAVDLRPVKAALRPVYAAKLRAMPEAQRLADPGLHAMRNLIDEPDFVPLSRAETDIGALKAHTRKTISAPMRSSSEGLAARAVHALEKQIRDRVARVGDPRAKLALQSGRRLTAAKYAAQDLLNQIRGFRAKSARDTQRVEPVRGYERLTAAGDRAATLLARTLKREPTLRPLIGRALLDEIFKKGTETGGLTRVDGMFRDWQNLGEATKRQLFTKPGHLADLDNFFQLMKRLGENVNPSGTGHMVSTLAQAKGFFHVAEGGLWFWSPIKMTLVELSFAKLAQMLHNPARARAIVRGLNWSVRRPTTKLPVVASVAASLERAAADAGVSLVPVQAPTAPVALPKAADEGEPDR